jgi:hypothetical protein
MRHRHTSPEATRRVAAALAEKDDWRATCPLCKAQRRGTPKQLKEPCEAPECPYNTSP